MITTRKRNWEETFVKLRNTHESVNCLDTITLFKSKRAVIHCQGGASATRDLSSISPFVICLISSGLIAVSVTVCRPSNSKRAATK